MAHGPLVTVYKGKIHFVGLGPPVLFNYDCCLSYCHYKRGRRL